MTSYTGITFTQLFDRDSAACFENTVFSNCVFDNSALSLTKSPQLRSTVRNVRLTACVSVNCGIGPALFDDVIIDGLETNDLLICWSPLFRHVTLKGKIGKIKVNIAAHFVDRSPEVQRPFDEARNQFYEIVDWALDISEAQFNEFDLHGVPARLVRRDCATQAIVTRDKALRPGWRDRLSSANKFWPMVIDMFLQQNEPDIILVAPKGKRKKDFTRLVEGLNELRQVGVAEPD